MLPSLSEPASPQIQNQTFEPLFAAQPMCAPYKGHRVVPADLLYNSLQYQNGHCVAEVNAISRV